MDIFRIFQFVGSGNIPSGIVLVVSLKSVTLAKSGLQTLTRISLACLLPRRYSTWIKLTDGEEQLGWSLSLNLFSRPIR